jgi:transketolase
VVLACTYKGRGLAGTEDQEGQHGKPLDIDTDQKVICELERRLNGGGGGWTPKPPPPPGSRLPRPAGGEFPKPAYQPGGKDVATRRAFGDALAAFAKVDERIVALDGDVKNSTYTELFEKAAPERFFQGYIAEQNMTGMAMGFASLGRIPFAATFGCFLARAYDFMRMAAISRSNIKLVGTHAGISIGEDGPSQMALEDLAMACAEPNYTVLYPCDATSAWRATALCAATPGPCYMRLGRPNSPVLYGPDETFAAGKCKVLRESAEDRALVVAAGVTVFEALAAHDELRKAGIAVRVIDLFSVQPIDAATLKAAARACGNRVITVEDHYAHGGIGDAVASALASEGVRLEKLAVREIPRSGHPKELLDRFGISARHIAAAVRRAAGAA